MNVYLITDGISRYGIEITIAVADSEDEAFSLMGVHRDDVFIREQPDYRMIKDPPLSNEILQRYTIEQIDSSTKGIKFNEYYGE